MKENFKYMIKNWLKWDRKSLIFFIIRVPALVFQPIITAYIPKAMIDCIEQGVTMGRLTAVIALLSLLLTMTIWMDPFMKELIRGGARIIRMRYAVRAFAKNLDVPYSQIESMENRNALNRAQLFYQGNHSSGQKFIENLNDFLVSVLGVITASVLLYKINFLVIVLILASCLCEFFIMKYMVKKEDELNGKRSAFLNKFDYYYALSKDNEAAKDIRLGGFGDYIIKTVAKIVYQHDKIISNHMKLCAAENSVRALLNFIRDSVAWIYLVYIVSSGQISISDFVFYFGIVTGFSNWVIRLTWSYNSTEKCLIDCKRYREYTESRNENDEKPDVDFDSVESIEFKNVTFTYPEAKSSTIKNMNFKIRKGENIAIVGENGAGKTTAVKLLCGLYFPSEGDILINGESSRNFNSKSYFKLFSALFQDYYFMPMTVQQNITASLDYDRDKLYNAFEKAGILDKINSLKDKENSLMNKEVYKQAIDFSGGEKQKLLLAKAIYKNAPILILDEPTAALDPIAENELYLKYNELTEDKISFFISHRLSSTRFCDRILFISDGQISECGTHEELMALKGAYYKMYQIQSYYYKEQGVEING